MTRDQIEAVFERVRTWPLERQEDAATMLLRMEEQGLEPLDLSDEEVADLQEAEREAERGEFVSEQDMEALFDRYRRG